MKRIYFPFLLKLSIFTVLLPNLLLPTASFSVSQNSFTGRNFNRFYAISDVENERANLRKRRAPPRLSGYILDPRDDRSVYHEHDSEVYRLLEKRARARREQNWQEADHILEELKLKYRVHVYDGSSPRFARVLSRQNSIPLSVLKERYEKQFGPNCHPYTHVGPPTLDPITCPLTINDIHNTLCRRIWLKLEKRFLEADSQLYELMTYGIEVNDDLKQWRSDGKAIFDKDWCRPPTQELTYKEITSLALPERTRVRIKQLVRQRAISLARRDVNLASALKYELAKTYRVVIDDFDLTWQILSESDQLDIEYLSLPSHPLFHPAVTSHLPTSAGLDPEHNWTKGGAYRYNEMVSSGRTLSLYEQVRVVSLLMQRDELRSIGYYVEADSIVRELWSTYEVDIHDARRQYCVGITFAEFDEQQTTESPNLVVSCSPESFHIQQQDVMRVETEPPRWWEAYKESGLSKTLDPNKAVEVENLIKYLSSQQQRNPNIVDRLIVRLEEEYGLLFDGTSWKLRSKILKYEPDSSKVFNLPNVGLHSIQELVFGRELKALLFSKIQRQQSNCNLTNFISLSHCMTFYLTVHK